MWRSRMPVRSTIQLSDVSTIFERSSLVSFLGGTARPVPTMRLRITKRPPRRAARAARRPRATLWRATAAVSSLRRPICANRSATKTAFLIAIAFEPPWQISATPSTPSSGAPPCSA